MFGPTWEDTDGIHNILLVGELKALYPWNLSFSFWHFRMSALFLFWNQCQNNNEPKVYRCIIPNEQSSLRNDITTTCQGIYIYIMYMHSVFDFEFWVSFKKNEGTKKITCNKALHYWKCSGPAKINEGGAAVVEA